MSVPGVTEGPDMEIEKEATLGSPKKEQKINVDSEKFNPFFIEDAHVVFHTEDEDGKVKTIEFHNKLAELKKNKEEPIPVKDILLKASLPPEEKYPCFSCGKTIKRIHKACRHCGSSNLRPGESMDLSSDGNRFFLTTSNFGARSAAGIPRAETEHDMPCPRQAVPDISRDPEINSYVFNHLPLKEDQKLMLLASLVHESKKTRKEEVKEEILKNSSKRREDELEVFRLKKKGQGIAKKKLHPRMPTAIITSNLS